MEFVRNVNLIDLTTAPGFSPLAAAPRSLDSFVPQTRLKRGLRATFTGLAINLFLSAAKMTAGILGHSHALVADSVESLADVFSSLVVWRGLVMASEPADEDHPYGHGKAEPIASALVSAMLLLAAAWIAIQSIHEIRQPHQAPAPFTLAVLALTVAIKESLFRYVRRESESLASSAMKSDAWHHRSDAVTSVAAAIGITVALIGGKSFAMADDIAALAAAGIIAWNGWHLLQQSLGELMDRSPSSEFVEKIKALASTNSEVKQVEKCLVRKMGYHYYVDMHLQVDPEMTVQHSHEIAHEVKDRIRARFPEVSDVLVHIEPAPAAAPPESSSTRSAAGNLSRH